MEKSTENKPNRKFNLLPYVLGGTGLLSAILGATAIGLSVSNNNNTTIVAPPAESKPVLPTEDITIEEIERQLSDIDFVNPSYSYIGKTIVVNGLLPPSSFVGEWEDTFYTNFVSQKVFPNATTTEYVTLKKTHSFNTTTVYFTFKARMKENEMFKQYLTKIIIKE